MVGPNPRRRPSPDGRLKLDLAGHCVMSLQKSATFHSTPSPVVGPDDPQLHVPSLPKRTPTCLGLTDACDDDRTLRVARWIRDVDQTLVDTGASTTASFDRLRDEELPLPAGVLAAVAPNVPHREEDVHPVDSISDVCTTSDSISLDHPGPPDRADPARRSRRPSSRRARRHQRQVSDSGIGSSVSGTISSPSEIGVGYGCVGETPTTTTTTTTTTTAIGSTISLIPTTTVDGQSCLSPHAARLVQKHIVEPLLQRDALSDFHPLVHDVSRQISDKELLCVRDLEKRLIWSAPGYSKSDRLYLLFCNTTIQCIHTAVTYIGEREHRRPRDAPYTNGYFVDLVEQIREYARMVAASRERRAAAASATAAASADADEADFSASDELKLVGGLSQTGQRAKLVRVKKGKTLALDVLPTASAVRRRPSDAGSVIPTSKRSLSEDEDDEDEDHLAHRSMARRRKLAPGETMSAPVLHTCSQCPKEFKRPCDLTKHEKTHSRPWKCQEPTCKFHSHGWPTEKERDRHFNDKHSTSPLMYRCHFRPCTYQSKRESNCKQHMEKSHGWTYERAKGNANGGGRGQRSSAGEASRPASHTPSTVPETATPASTLTEAHLATSPALSVQNYAPLAPLAPLNHVETATGLAQLPGGEMPLQSEANTTKQDQTGWLLRPDSEAERMISQPLDVGQLDVPSPFSHAVNAFPSDDWLNTDLPAARDPSSFNDDYTGLWMGVGPFDTRQGQLLTPQQSAERRAYGSFSGSSDHRQTLEDLEVDFGIGPSMVQGAGRVGNEAPPLRLAPPLSSVSQARVALSSPAFDDETFGDCAPQLGSGTADFQLYDPNEPAFGGTGEAAGTSTTQIMFPDLRSFSQPLYGHELQQQPTPPQLRDSQQQHDRLPGYYQAPGSAASQQDYSQALTTPPVDFLADFMDTDP